LPPRRIYRAVLRQLKHLSKKSVKLIRYVTRHHCLRNYAKYLTSFFSHNGKKLTLGIIAVFLLKTVDYVKFATYLWIHLDVNKN